VNWAKAWKAAAKTRVALRDFDQLWAAYQDATKLMFKALDKVSAVEEERDAARRGAARDKAAAEATAADNHALRERVEELEAELTRAAADLRHLTHNGNNLDHLIGRLERLTTPGAKP
jgi:uncharacterized protein (DUF3084 family)